MSFPHRSGRWAWLIAFFISAAPAQERLALCAGCHGADGNSTDPKVPSLAGQPPIFIENQLILFREELRKSEAMQPVVKGLKDADIVALARHFAAQPAKVMETARPDAALMKRGRAKARELRCGVCHVSDFSGQKQMPRLAGQREQYLASEMRAYRDNRRSGGDTIMAATLYGVSDEDVTALAHFLSRAAPRKASAPARGR